MLTQARLHELLSYDPETGIFIHLKHKHHARIGKPAGSRNSDGYLTAWLDGKHQKLHRMAWLYMTGRSPENQIDHIDGNRTNNAFLNLRDVHKDINSQNQHKAQSHNKSSGLLGVFRNNNSNKFMARISVRNKKIYLGSFDTAVEAHDAYIRAKRIHHEGCTI